MGKKELTETQKTEIKELEMTTIRHQQKIEDLTKRVEALESGYVKRN